MYIIKKCIDICLEHSFLYEENFIKSLSNILNIKNTCGYITCVTTPTKYEKKFSSEQPILNGQQILYLYQLINYFY